MRFASPRPHSSSSTLSIPPNAGRDGAGGASTEGCCRQRAGGKRGDSLSIRCVSSTRRPPPSGPESLGDGAERHGGWGVRGSDGHERAGVPQGAFSRTQGEARGELRKIASRGAVQLLPRAPRGPGLSGPSPRPGNTRRIEGRYVRWKHASCSVIGDQTEDSPVSVIDRHVLTRSRRLHRLHFLRPIPRIGPNPHTTTQGCRPRLLPRW